MQSGLAMDLALPLFADFFMDWKSGMKISFVVSCSNGEKVRETADSANTPSKQPSKQAIDPEGLVSQFNC